MFVINEDKSIYITRGDVAFFTLSTETESGEAYKFQAGDVVRFKVTEKKACENVVLSKDFGIEAETEEVEIYLEESDTKIGEVISKPTDYWYEVELNPYTDPQTIIGYDDDGPKVFKLFPEGNEAEDSEPITPEDIPVVDEELSLTSTRPVQNQAIARAITSLRENFNTVLTQTKEDVSSDLAEIKAIKENVEGDYARLSEEAGRLEEEIAKLTEDSEKLSEDLANAESILESLAVEDISESFISSTGSGVYTSAVEVYKQGNVICGSVVISPEGAPNFTEGETFFTVNSVYRPKCSILIPTMAVLGGEGEEGDSGIAVRYFGNTGAFKVIKNTREYTGMATLSFTYICN